jgi:hypothetical protein
MPTWALVAVLAVLLAAVLTIILLTVRSTKRRNPHIYHQDENG